MQTIILRLLVICMAIPLWLPSSCNPSSLKKHGDCLFTLLLDPHNIYSRFDNNIVSILHKIMQIYLAAFLEYILIISIAVSCSSNDQSSSELCICVWRIRIATWWLTQSPSLPAASSSLLPFNFQVQQAEHYWNVNGCAWVKRSYIVKDTWNMRR